jgi:hypothetical protein
VPPEIDVGCEAAQARGKHPTSRASLAQREHAAQQEERPPRCYSLRKIVEYLLCHSFRTIMNGSRA